MADITLSPPRPPLGTVAAVSVAEFSPDLALRPRLLRLAVAVGGGLVISGLTLFQPAGVGWSLAVLVGIAAFFAFARLGGRTPSKTERLLLALIAVIGAFFSLRTSSWLVNYNTIAVVMLAACLPLFARRNVALFSRLRPEDFLRETRRTLGQTLVGPVREANQAVNGVRGSYPHEAVAPVLRGLAFGVPAAVVFVSLFASADETFNALLSRAAFDVDDNVFLRVLTVGLWSFMLLGSWAATERAKPRRVTARRKTITGLSAATVLAVLNLVFSAFVMVQLLAALGVTGSLLENPSAISSAAREGFFQLLWVVGLVFTLILGLDRRLPSKERSRAVVVGQATLIVLTELVALSALLRMHRYTDAFGLTELRFHATAFMLLLSLLLGWMGFTLVRRRRGMFVGPALMSFAGFVIAMNLVNPDLLIARYNVARATAKDADVDIWHLYELSADALPYVQTLDVGGDWARSSLHWRIEHERRLLRDAGWRGWNVARAQAAALEAQ